jgi:nitrogen fixation NifU-like protein
MNLYGELILAHARAPRGVGLPPDAVVADVASPSCGDRSRIGVCVDAGRVIALGHETDGCALCVASASLLCEIGPGHSPAALVAARAALAEVVAGATGDPVVAPGWAFAPLAAFAAVARFPVRRECVLLPWLGLTQALERELSTWG